MTSMKPYLLRAIYEWILDNEMTPHVVVDVRYPGVSVPEGYAEEGRLILNLSPGAVQGLVMRNDLIELNARFGGVARHVSVPLEAVQGIFTRENGQGMVFPDPLLPTQDQDSAHEKKTARTAAQKSSEKERPVLKAAPRPVATEPAAGPAPGTPKGQGGAAPDKPKGKSGPTLKVVK